LVALLLLSTNVRSERIYLTSAAATYWTATGSVELRLTFREPPNFVSRYFEACVQFGDVRQVPATGGEEWFTIDNCINYNFVESTTAEFSGSYAATDSKGKLTLTS
jgi:hypothetical protein